MYDFDDMAFAAAVIVLVAVWGLGKALNLI